MIEKIGKFFKHTYHSIIKFVQKFCHGFTKQSKYEKLKSNLLHILKSNKIEKCRHYLLKRVSTKNVHKSRQIF